MTDPSHSRLMAEMFVEMLHDEEYLAIISPDSESEISDADDLDQGCQTQGPRAYSGPPHNFMWPARAFVCLTKKKKYVLLLYIVH